MLPNDIGFKEDSAFKFQTFKRESLSNEEQMMLEKK